MRLVKTDESGYRISPIKLCVCAIGLLITTLGCSSNTENSLATDVSDGNQLEADTQEDIEENNEEVLFASVESCDGDTPVNVDGYYESSFNPLSLEAIQFEGSNFIDLQPTARSDNYVTYRIGVSATYNLGNQSLPAQPNDAIAVESRLSCAAPGRYTVGPELTSLSVSANLPVSDNYPTGSELNDALSIAPLQRAVDANYPPTQAYVPTQILRSTEYYSLPDFIKTGPAAPIAFLLKLNVQPMPVGEYIFTITYTLSNGLSGSVSVSAVSFN